MSENVELSTLNLRYEGYRLRDDAGEARLRASIAERGIEEPLEGIDTPDDRFLLNGFKRRRSAEKLEIHCAAYVSLAEEEASGPNKSLQILEQARFVVEYLTNRVGQLQNAVVVFLGSPVLRTGTAIDAVASDTTGGLNQCDADQNCRDGAVPFRAPGQRQ